MPQPLRLEHLLRRDRAVTAAGLVVLAALAWLYLLSGAGLGMSPSDMTRLTLFPHQSAAAGHDMAGMNMPGMEMAAATSAEWDLRLWFLIPAMWWVMMIAMMAPSAAPTALLYARVYRHAQARADSAARLAPTGVFVAGYLLAWLGFAVAATVLHFALERMGLISAAAMGSQSRWLSAGVLLAAGVYQFSPLQRVCLDHCRAPADFLARNWRPGSVGAVRLGAMHGAFCIGCCWALMGLLFVGGVMNLAWIAALALLVLAEKVLPHGRWVGRAAGGLLIAWGAATLAL